MKWSGQPMRSTGVCHAGVVQVLDDRGAEAVVEDVVLEGAEDFALRGEVFDGARRRAA